MRSAIARALLVGLLALVAAGCQTARTQAGGDFQQARAFDVMNDQLFDLYHAKLQVREDADVVVEEDVKTRLRDLAGEAERRARASQEPRDRIGFYRIAVVAAWQGETTGVLDLADAGRVECDGAEEQWNVAPRDCALIAVAGDVAVADAAARQVEALQEQYGAGPVPADEGTRLAELLAMLISRHGGLTETLAKVETVDAPPAFAVRLRSDMNDVLCNAEETYTLLTHVEGVDVSQARRLKDALDERGSCRRSTP